MPASTTLYSSTLFSSTQPNVTTACLFRRTEGNLHMCSICSIFRHTPPFHGWTACPSYLGIKAAGEVSGGESFFFLLIFNFTAVSIYSLSFPCNPLFACVRGFSSRRKGKGFFSPFCCCFSWRNCFGCAFTCCSRSKNGCEGKKIP